MNITFKTKTCATLGTSDFQTMPLIELENYIAMNNAIHLHECLGERTRPIFDFDMKCFTKEEYSSKKDQTLISARQIVLEQFPSTVFPKAVINCLTSCGPAKWVKKVEGVATNIKGWKISCHFIVSGVGSWPRLNVKEIATRFNGLKDNWDLGIYSLGHTMRMPYCTKEGEDRYLQFAIITNKTVNVYEDFEVSEVSNTSLLDWLMTSEEPEFGEYVEKKKKKNDDDDEEDEDEEEKHREDWTKWNFDMAKRVILRLNKNRAVTHSQRVDGIASIIHLAKILKKKKSFRELAHLFAMNDSNYSEAQTDIDYDYYYKSVAPDVPRTFDSLRKFATEDNPVEKLQLEEGQEIALTFYDKIHEVLHKVPLPSLVDIQKYLMGCLRYCDRKGDERWYQHSTDGWYAIENKKNFPFGSVSSNENFDDTTLYDIMIALKSTAIFKANCLTEGAVFYPWVGVNDRPNIINLFRGWPMIKTDDADEEAVDEFLEYIDMLFDQSPQLDANDWYIQNHDNFDAKCSDYVVNTIARKLQFPREKGKTICGYGKFGGEGKNVLEMFLTQLFGMDYCVKSAGTKELLGQGEQGFNPLAEKCLVAFIQEAKKDGQSIADSEKFKSWQTEYTQMIRRMRENPYQASNYGQAFIWTNNKSFMKMESSSFRRMFVAHINPSMIDETDPRVKTYFDNKVMIIRSPKKMQAIFNYLITLNVSKFDSNNIPITALMNSLKLSSLTPIQNWVQEVCNDEEIPRTKKGMIQFVAADTFQMFRTWAQSEGMADRFIAQKPAFRETLKELDIEFKVIKINNNSIQGCVIDLVKVESMMRKMLKNKEWCLIKPKEEVTDDE